MNMRIIIYTLLSLASLAISIQCFGILLVSCSGHPPTTVIGMWILPVSLFCAGIFLYLSLFFWKVRQYQPPEVLKKEAKLLPKKILIFFVSFVIATVLFFLLLGLILFQKTVTFPNWMGYVIYALCIGLGIYSGVVIYKRLTKRNV